MHRLLLLFALFCSPLFAETSYSLVDCNGVPFDEKLLAIMNYRNGTFIEVGAHDGLSQSNTKRFEEYYGWTGVLIEPSKDLYAALRANRPGSKCFSCALGSFEEHGTYVYGDFDGSLMSSVHGERLRTNANLIVPMRSLQSILDEANLHHINFFSLDTEGYELNILKGVDFNRTTFDYLLIEIYTKDYDKIIAFLREKGYAMIDSFSNYKHETHPDWSGTHNDYLFRRISLSGSP